MTDPQQRTPQPPAEDGAFTERTPRIVAAAKLHRAAARRKAGRFLAEGENAVTSAVRYGNVLELFVTEQASQRFAPLLAEAQGRTRARVSPITDRAGDRLSETVHHTGLFALCADQLVELGQEQALLPRPTGSTLAVAVETSEPGNAGTLIRVADAFGAQGVLCAGECVDPQGGKAVRASAGSLFHLPVTRPRPVPDVLEWLRAQGYTVLATAMDAERSLIELGEEAAQWRRSGCSAPAPVLAGPVAWLFGNEAHGLGQWAHEADIRVRIPMAGRAESLNLATAASVCLYESARAHARLG